MMLLAMMEQASTTRRRRADTLAWLRSTLTISVNPPLDPEGVSYPTPRAHFNAVIAAAGLVEVASEEMA